MVVGVCDSYSGVNVKERSSMTLLLELCLIGLLLSILFTPVGCVLIWKRLSFLSDTLSHASILGVAIGSLTHCSSNSAHLVFLLLFVVLLAYLLEFKRIPQDTVLSILSYSGMSLGLILLHFSNNTDRVQSILFGDILTLDRTDFYLLGFLCLLINAYLYRYQKTILLMCVNEDLAHVHGIRVRQHRFIFLVLAAFVVGMGMKSVGALIVPAILILPCCAMRPWFKEVIPLVIGSLTFACIGMLISSILFHFYHMPFGPLVVTVYSIGLGVNYVIYYGVKRLTMHFMKRSSEK